MESMIALLLMTQNIDPNAEIKNKGCEEKISELFGQGIPCVVTLKKGIETELPHCAIQGNYFCFDEVSIFLGTKGANSLLYDYLCSDEEVPPYATILTLGGCNEIGTTVSHADKLDCECLKRKDHKEWVCKPVYDK